MKKTDLDEIINSYKWIKVKKHVDDSTKTFEERFTELEKHHIDETTFLIEKIRELAKELGTENSILKQHLQVFADAIAIILPRNQGVVVEITDEAKEIYTDISTVAVTNSSGKINIEKGEKINNKKHGDKILLITNDENLN